MFDFIKNTWNRYGFEILVVISLLFLGIFGIYCKFSGKKGSWSRLFYSPPPEKLVFNKDQKSDSKGEIECRRVLETLFRGRKFDKARPNFLRNPVTGGNFNLELDCYNPELRLAVEYNGIQHYKYVPYFHKNKEAFLNQKYRDDMKRRICRENRINLIEVPYTVKIKDISHFIRKELTILGY